MALGSRMIPTEDASVRKREIEEKLKQVRNGGEEAKLHRCSQHTLKILVDNKNASSLGICDMTDVYIYCVILQEQETLSFIRENMEKSDQLTKGMVGRETTHGNVLTSAQN